MAKATQLLLLAAAQALIAPMRRLKPTRQHVLPPDAIDVLTTTHTLSAIDVLTTTHTLAANSALTSTADELAGSLFGASLLPWLAMLYWLKHPKVQAPAGVGFGLTYLLAFVFGSIPAAIGAGALYGASLADADWLHGAAESLLAATNCVVVLGFRDALAGKEDAGRLRTAGTAWAAFATISCLVVVGANDLALSAHAPWLGGAGDLPGWAEPANALSVPTWIIHTSSLVEWLVAMGLAWRYADVTGRPEWKGVTWGMLPLHTSGIVACCYHLFYNAPELSWCVTLQAGCTCLGNTTLAFAMYRLAVASGWTWGDGRADVEALHAKLVDGAETEAVAVEAPAVAVASTTSPATSASLLGWEDLGDAWALDSDVFFLGKLLALSAFLAYVVKYTPPLIPDGVVSGWSAAGDGAHSGAAALVIVVPTLLNCAKWYQRSQTDEFVGDF